MTRVGFWAPTPGSNAAPTRCFRWTAEALANRTDIKVRVGSPRPCDWDVNSVQVPSAEELAKSVDVVHWNHVMNMEFPILADAKTVLTYHGDVQWCEPALNYGDYPYFRSLKERLVELAKLWQFDAICFVSNDVRQRMTERLPYALSRQTTTYNGVPPHIDPNTTPAREEPYLFHVSAHGPRKNPEGLVRGYRESGVDAPLVVAGSGWENVHGVESLGFVPDEELSSWYVGAEAFLFPSAHECFGLPIVEAIACGTPVVTSNRYAMSEIARGEAVLCNPDDPADIGRAIEEAVGTTQQPKTLFTWEDTASDLANLYQSL